MARTDQKTHKNTQKRSFLLLQGVASPFFNQLETALLAANQRCLKINFCGGDKYTGERFKPYRHALDYTGTLNDLGDFYTQTFAAHEVTDIVLFGDTRPVHLSAIELATQQSIRIHVFEEGYFRPNWVTLDSGGVNAFSSLYRASNNQAQWFLQHASEEPNWHETSESTGGNLLIRAWHDIRYHLARVRNQNDFPHYKSHRPDSALAEYWGFIRRIPLVSLYYNDRSNHRIQKLLKSQAPYYLLPLQLEADSQMRVHSNFSSLAQVIETTLTSFAQNAPENACLVIKLHPLDPWFVNYRQLIIALEKKLNLDTKRVFYLEAGDLQTLLKYCAGTVLVNSTVGTSALAAGCPVIALGKAIFNVDGLTFQGDLADFWTQATPPNAALFDAFRQCYISRTQVNGSFYNRKGIAMAVENSVPKLLSDERCYSMNEKKSK